MSRGWSKLYDDLWSDRTLRRLDPVLFMAYIRGQSYSSAHLTDGVLTAADLTDLGINTDTADALVMSRLWRRCPTGWKQIAWKDEQRDAATAQKQRDLAAQRAREFRARQKQLAVRRLDRDNA